MSLRPLGRALALVLVAAAVGAQPAIDIDVPVRLGHARVVFNTDQRLENGAGVPTVFVWLDEMLLHFEAWRTRRKLLVVLHGPAGVWALSDDAWNRVHDVTTGNPHAAQIAALAGKRVEFELCAYTMQLNGWTNADLLPEVQVVTGAIARLIQLQQRGWTVLQP